MPTYNFRNKETGEEFEKFFTSWSLKDKFLEENKNIEQTVGSPAIVSGVSGNKPDDGFRDLLRNMKRRLPGNNINSW